MDLLLSYPQTFNNESPTLTKFAKKASLKVKIVYYI